MSTNERIRIIVAVRDLNRVMASKTAQPTDLRQSIGALRYELGLAALRLARGNRMPTAPAVN